MYQRGFLWMDFREIRQWGRVEKLHVWLKSGKNIEHFT
jgi:hypothetical protein